MNNSWINSLILALLVASFFSCSEKKEKRYSEQEYIKIADSLYQQKAIIIIQDAEKNLELRKRIELRELTEKIIEDRRKGKKTTVPEEEKNG